MLNSDTLYSVNRIIDSNTILSEDSFQMKSVGSSAIQPPNFPGLGSQNFRRNGITYTNIATKSAVTNQLESSLVDSQGRLTTALKQLPHLSVITQKENQQYQEKFTTLELPHRLGSGVFTLIQKDSDWDFPEILYEKMCEVGPYNAIAYFDPISALFGCYLSHYNNIPSNWSKFTGAITGGCVASNTQQVISSAVTKDPLGSNEDEIGFSLENVRVSQVGMGNIVHLSNDIDAESIQLNMFMNQSRLKFYDSNIQELLIHIYKYTALKTLHNGFDFRNRCYLKPLMPVEFDEVSLSKNIQASIRKCKKLHLLNNKEIVRILPLQSLK